MPGFLKIYLFTKPLCICTLCVCVNVCMHVDLCVCVCVCVCPQSIFDMMCYDMDPV